MLAPSRDASHGDGCLLSQPFQSGELIFVSESSPGTYGAESDLVRLSEFRLLWAHLGVTGEPPIVIHSRFDSFLVEVNRAESLRIGSHGR